jgi:anti-sigma factor RsiW
VKKEFVTDQELSERYEKIMDSKTRTARKSAEMKPISERLKEGAAQAERDKPPALFPPKIRRRTDNTTSGQVGPKLNTQNSSGIIFLNSI